MLEFYTEVLVPIFAGAGFVAFLLNVWKFFEDRRRASRRFKVHVDGAMFRVINETGTEQYFASGGYIDRKWRAMTGSFSLTGAAGLNATATVIDKIPANGALELLQTLNTTLSAAWEAFGGKKIEARGWWARLKTGEVATTIPAWNLYGRLRFWLANLGRIP